MARKGRHRASEGTSAGKKKKKNKMANLVNLIKSFLVLNGGESTLSKIATAVQSVKPKGRRVITILKRRPQHFLVKRHPEKNDYLVELVTNNNSLDSEIPIADDEEDEEEDEQEDDLPFLAPPPEGGRAEAPPEAMDVTMARPFKKSEFAPPTLMSILHSLKEHEIVDPNEYPILLETISNYATNRQMPTFVGIDFRNDLSGQEGPGIFLDLIIGRTKLTLDCEPFSAVHGPHWLQTLLAHEGLYPMIGNPQHLWEGGPLTASDTNPLAELNVLDYQLVAEYLFHEPYLEWESILGKLLKLRFDKEHMPRLHNKHRKNLFFQLLWDEMEQKLHAQDILMLQTATKNRVLNVQARYQFGFDSTNAYSTCSITLANIARENKPHLWQSQHLLDKMPLRVDNGFSSLSQCLPPRLLTKLIRLYQNDEHLKENITEIVLDLGQRPYLWADGKRIFFGSTTDVVFVEQTDIDYILEKGQFRFGGDNRAALPGQLHRITAMRDRDGKIYGLTLRFGRHVHGNASLIHDLLCGTTKSILILGPSGSGKTTLIRDIARVISEDVANTVIVDTSNEIGGDSEVPHPCVGLARRMMVPSLEEQSSIMLECVQNHTPHVMVIDEIGRSNEVAAARTIKKRRVRLIASAHGDLRGLVANANLNGLIGGVQTYTLGDGLAEEHEAAKVVIHRMGAPVFNVIIELGQKNQHEWKVIMDPREAVDAVLNGDRYSYELRTRNPETFEMSMVRLSEG